MPGGPQTEEGKASSRQNAVRHGLSSQTLLADILGRGAIESAYDALVCEWRPTSLTEHTLLREMARHQVALERIEQMEEATLRRGALGGAGLLLSTMTDPSDEEERDAVLASAGTADAVEKISRYRRPHEKGYYRSLATLEALRAARACRERKTDPHQTPAKVPLPATSKFQTECDCEAYLHRRFLDGRITCLECGDTGGKYIPSRKSWRCRKCQREVSLRAGTIMAGSHVELLSWFHAIEWLSRARTSSVKDLRTVTSIQRDGTLRRMVREIQKAFDSTESDSMLAGLAAFFRNTGF